MTRSIVSASSTRRAIGVRISNCPAPRPCFPRSYNGSIGRIAFPTKNLMEILTHYQSGELTLTLTGAEGPCGINGTEDPDYTVLIMPMKIAEESYYEEN